MARHEERITRTNSIAIIRSPAQFATGLGLDHTSAARAKSCSHGGAEVTEEAKEPIRRWRSQGNSLLCALREPCYFAHLEMGATEPDHGRNWACSSGGAWFVLLSQDVRADAPREKAKER